MNNFLDSVDTLSTRSQTVDDHLKDPDVKSETSRRSSKQFVDRDLNASFDIDSKSDKLMSDSDVDQGKSDNIEQVIDGTAQEGQGLTNEMDTTDRTIPNTSDNLDNVVLDSTQSAEMTDKDMSVESQTVKELSQGDGSVVC